MSSGKAPPVDERAVGRETGGHDGDADFYVAPDCGLRDQPCG